MFVIRQEYTPATVTPNIQILLRKTSDETGCFPHSSFFLSTHVVMER